MSKYLIEHDKTYIAILKLGQKKDTGDNEGQVIEEAEVDVLDEEKVRNVFASFVGKQKQAPHKYSAVKIDGKKLYEYARAGEDVEIPKRDIEIYALNLLNLDDENKEICFEVSCSKGTYIRVLCEDIAEKLGTVGYMNSLQRTKVSEFYIEKSVKIADLSTECVLPVENFCTKYPKIELNNRKLELFLNGVMLTFHENDGIYRIYNNQKFIGLGIVKNELLKRDIVIGG